MYVFVCANTFVEMLVYMCVYLWYVCVRLYLCLCICMRVSKKYKNTKLNKTACLQVIKFIKLIHYIHYIIVVRLYEIVMCDVI